MKRLLYIMVIYCLVGAASADRYSDHGTASVRGTVKIPVILNSTDSDLEWVKVLPNGDILYHFTGGPPVRPVQCFDPLDNAKGGPAKERAQAGEKCRIGTATTWINVTDGEIELGATPEYRTGYLKGDEIIHIHNHHETANLTVLPGDFSFTFSYPGVTESLHVTQLTEEVITMCDAVDDCYNVTGYSNQRTPFTGYVIIEPGESSDFIMSYTVPESSEGIQIKYNIVFDGVLLDPYHTNNGTNWDNGTFTNTVANETSGRLHTQKPSLTGSYLSEVIDSQATSADWRNLTTAKGAKHLPLPENAATESFYGGVNMSGNVAYYPFNESDDQPILDYSGYGHIGNESCNMSAPGVHGTSANFTGEAGSLIDLNAKIYPIAMNGSNQTTTMAWVHPFNASPLAANTDFVYLSTRQAGRNHGMGLWDSNRVLCTSASTTLITEHIAISQKGVPANNWTHIACVTNYADDWTAIYINGVLDSNTTTNFILTYMNASSGIFDDFVGGTNIPFDHFYGYIDELALFNRSLGTDEIFLAYQRAAGNMSVYFRSCSDSVCAFPTAWELVDTPYDSGPLASANNRYAQYNISFTSEGVTVSPELESVTVGYEIVGTTTTTTTTSPTTTTTTLSPLANTTLRIHSQGDAFYRIALCDPHHANKSTLVNESCTYHDAGDALVFNASSDPVIKLLPIDYNITNMGGSWAIAALTDMTFILSIIAIGMIMAILMALLWITQKSVF